MSLKQTVPLWIVVQKKASSNDEAFLKMAPPAGLEPATYGLTVRRSTN